MSKYIYWVRESQVRKVTIYSERVSSILLFGPTSHFAAGQGAEIGCFVSVTNRKPMLCSFKKSFWITGLGLWERHYYRSQKIHRIGQFKFVDVCGVAHHLKIQRHLSILWFKLGFFIVSICNFLRLDLIGLINLGVSLIVLTLTHPEQIAFF